MVLDENRRLVRPVIMCSNERTIASDSLMGQPQHMKYEANNPQTIISSKSASSSSNSTSNSLDPSINPLSMLTGSLLPIDHFRLKLYNYAMVERLRYSQYPSVQVPGMCSPHVVNGASNSNPGMGPYVPRLALSMGIFHNRMFQPAEEPKPQHSYIGLIAMAILSAPEVKLVLSDIYQHILDNYPYFRTRGPGWRNSIRHNLSLNDCFIKAGRSASGKGHYWSIHPANVDDFKKGDFRRRKAQRKVRKHMGLAVDDEGTDSPSPPPMPSSTSPTSLFPASWSLSQSATIGVVQQSLYQQPHRPPFPQIPFHHRLIQHHHTQMAAFQTNSMPTSIPLPQQFTHHPLTSTRKRQFDVASLLAPDSSEETRALNLEKVTQRGRYHPQIESSDREASGDELCQQTILNGSDYEEDIDVVANDTDNFDHKSTRNGSESPIRRHREDDDEPRRAFKVQKLMDRDDGGSRRDSPRSIHELAHHWTSGIETKILEQYYGHYMATAAHQASRFLVSHEDVHPDHHSNNSTSPPAINSINEC